MNCRSFESNENIESEYKRLHTKHWRRREIVRSWTDYEFKFNQKALIDFRLSKTFCIDSKLIQNVLKWNNVVNSLKWMNSVVSSNSKRFEAFDNENLNRTSINVVKQWVERMISLQKFVYRSRKLNNLIENESQNVDEMQENVTIMSSSWVRNVTAELNCKKSCSISKDDFKIKQKRISERKRNWREKKSNKNKIE